MTDSLENVDKEIYNYIQDESDRQFSGLELIASENFTSRAVMDALGSCLTNKYSEGIPGKRYYGGNEIIDKIEMLCQKRALEAFRLNPIEWGVNVQGYSGSTANFAIYTSLMNPNDRIMGLDLNSGGHLTHGYQTSKKKISASSIYFESFSYHVNPETGFIDYEKLRKDSLIFKPKMIICGGSAYPRDWEYSTLREIADQNGSLLFCDMSHYSGLVASQLLKNPFGHTDVVMTTTHKSLAGPRGALIFYRKKLEDKINFGIFPATQGGPHNNTIAAIAVQLKEVTTLQFKEYALQVQKNAKILASELQKFGYKLATDGTDTHLILWDLRPLNVSGNKLEHICDSVGITINKNAICGDVSALSPKGVRLGTCALTSRLFKEQDFCQVASLLHQVVLISMKIENYLKSSGSLYTFMDFKECMRKHFYNELNVIKGKVLSFSRKFSMPGKIIPHP